jgi:hypothetical protein
MSWRYSGLSIILILAALAARIPSIIISSDAIPSSWFEPPTYDDPEGRLAMGHKLPLACADMWALELLKGVSDTLALELIDKRYEIIRASFNTSPVEAIKKAHGIGDKTATKLLEYLDLQERCHISEPYEMWHKLNPPFPSK